MTNRTWTGVVNAPVWILLFVALMVFNVFTVSFGLFVTHRVVEEYHAAIDDSQHLSEHTEAFANLSRASSALNQLGNDIFLSRDLAREQAAFAAASAAFDASFFEAEEHLYGGALAGGGSLHAVDVANELDEIAALRGKIHTESAATFAAFRADREGEAGRHMAQMDRASNRLIEVIAAVVEKIEHAERKGLQVNLAAVERMRSMELVTGLLLIAMILAATYYGLTLARVWRQARETEEAKKIAEDLNEARSAFLATMSHELRTPLASIKSYAEVLREEAVAGERAQDIHDIDVILKSSAHLLRMISDVLEASKLEAGKVRLERVQFDIEQDLVRHVADTIRPVAAARGNLLTVSVSGTLGAASTDLTRLRQCLLNLASNAAKFTMDGTIALDAAVDGEGDARVLRLSVRDTGIGMTPGEVDKLFQPFQQANAGINSKYGGTGLGLHITRGFVELMGGAIAVESVEGVGTTFTLTVPAVLANVAEADARLAELRRAA